MFAKARPPLYVQGALLSNVGGVRSHNEDSVVFTSANDRGPGGQDALVLVADGMGGHAAGEVASGLAVEIIRQVFFESEGPVPRALAAAFFAANNAVLEHGRNHPECSGMGTTCTAIAIKDSQAWIAQVGDSRAYLLRKSKLTQLTEDQTLVAKLVREGTMTAKQAKESNYSNVILQAIGTSEVLEPEISKKGAPLSPGDVLIICTDGLHGLVSDTEIASTAGRLAPAAACEALIDAAIKAGGHDNVSVGVFHVVNEIKPESDRSKRTTRKMKPPPELFEPRSSGS